MKPVQKVGMDACDVVYHIIVQNNMNRDEHGEPQLIQHSVGLWKSMGDQNRDFTTDRICMESYATLEKIWKA